MRSGKALAATMAYLMYRDCAEGELYPEWKVDVPLSIVKFRWRLSKQMCEYRTYYSNYFGDLHLRKTMKRSKPNRNKNKTKDEKLTQNRVTYKQYVDEKYPKSRCKMTRFCNDNLDDLNKHFHSFLLIDYSLTCEVCGEKGAYWTCGICYTNMTTEKLEQKNRNQ